MQQLTSFLIYKGLVNCCHFSLPKNWGFIQKNWGFEQKNWGFIHILAMQHPKSSISSRLTRGSTLVLDCTLLPIHPCKRGGVYIPGTCKCPLFWGRNPAKRKPFAFKAGAIWIPGIYCKYVYNVFNYIIYIWHIENAIIICCQQRVMKCATVQHTFKNGIPSRSLTVRPWKVTFPIGKDRLPTIHFQGRTVKLREGNSTTSKEKSNILGLLVEPRTQKRNRCN